MKLTITKADAARRQIETAIDLLFLDKDKISIHTLTMAGFGILKDLAEQRGPRDFLERAIASIKEEKRGEFWQIMKAPSNFLKHANRDPEDVLEFPVYLAEGFICFAITLYGELGNNPTLRMRSFLVVFLMMNPDLLNEGLFKDIVHGQLAGFEALGGPLTRKEILSTGLQALRRDGIEI